MNLNSSFRRAIQKLSSPTSLRFSATEWRSALDAAEDRSQEDETLLETAKWIAGQSLTLRSVSLAELEKLGANTSKILAVGVCNIEFKAERDLSEDAAQLAQESGALALDHLTALPLKGAMEGQTPSAAAHAETVVDATESWIFDACGLNEIGCVPPADLSPIMLRAAAKYSIRRSHNDLWNQALYEGYYLHIREDGALFWIPGDLSGAIHSAAWLARQESNFINRAFSETPAWNIAAPERRRQLAPFRTVVKVESGDRRKIKVGIPRYLSKKRPSILFEITGVEDSYLGEFLDTPFPSDPRFNLRMLLLAWNAISDLATILDNRTTHEHFPDEKNIRSRALIVNRNDLVGAIMDTLSVKKDLSESVIEFLTFRLKVKKQKGYKGLWSSPLVPLQENEFALVLPSLRTSATLRKCEAWAEKGGLDDNLAQRGSIFETQFRKSLSSRLRQNKIFTDAGNADNGLKKNSIFPEQVDVLFYIGDVLFVGEVKFHITPAESIEKYHHYQKLGDASAQARRKADAVRHNPRAAAKALGIDEYRIAAMRIVPLVIDSQGFGFADSIDGCWVTETRYLLTILTSGVLVTQGAISTSGGDASYKTVDLYRSISEFESTLNDLFLKPHSLEGALKRIKWKLSTFPTASGLALNILMPYLGDFAGKDFDSAAMLRKAISRATG